MEYEAVIGLETHVQLKTKSKMWCGCANGRKTSHHFYKLGVVASKLVFLIALRVCLARESGPTAMLFEQAVKVDGTNYVQARQEILARGAEVTPFLKQMSNSQDWREKLEAEILLGWIENPSLYAELWDWHAPESMQRNPFPAYKRGARKKFSDAGNAAIPVMLELIWKMGDIQYGAFPELLAERKVERSLPVLVRSKQGVPRVMGFFGENATEHILEAFPAAQREHRSWLIEALGFTGGANAVLKLIDLLKSETESFGREAATALGNLGQYAFLRDEYSRVKTVEVRLAMLEGLTKDKSAENRKHLLLVATTAIQPTQSAYGDERFTAFNAIMTDATAEDVKAVCDIYAREPDDRTRWCIIACLHHSKSPLVRETLLKALKDRSPLVRALAIDHLRPYEDEEVTAEVVSIYRSDEVEACRAAAIQVLMYRNSPLIGEVALTRLEDKNPYIQRWSINALGRNPVPGAIARLTELLSSTNSECRASAAMALGNIGGEAVLKSLEKAELKEKEEIVRRMIRAAIQTAKDAERIKR